MSLVSYISSFTKRFEREISIIIFLGSFILDNITFDRIDVGYVNFLFAVYLTVTATAIALYSQQSRSWAGRLINSKVGPFIRFAMEFCFGGLFSAFFVFYAKSSTLITSWPFVLLLLSFVFGSEFFKSKYSSLVFQVSVWYFSLLSYLIFLWPIIRGSISTMIFVQSSVISLVAIFVAVILLALLSPTRIREARKGIVISVFSIFAAMQILYFTNIIPPLPLSLKEIGIYHEVIKSDTSYVLQEEAIPWYKRMYNPTYHVIAGEPIYVWSSIFAPTKLSTQIYHQWQYYDENKKGWVSLSKVTYPIVGGRDGGYRGYSLKQNIMPGKWRVNVLTANDRVVGRINFSVETVDSPVPLQEVTR